MENWLEFERDQLPLWIPVGLSLGIATWFSLPGRGQWIAFLLLAGGFATMGVAVELHQQWKAIEDPTVTPFSLSFQALLNLWTKEATRQLYKG